MPSEIQKLAERVRTIADQCHGWSTAAGQQADRCRATANSARALRQRGQGNPRVLDALVSQLDTAARECETTATRLAQLSRMLFEFAGWLAMPAGPAKIASKPANVVAGSGKPDATPPTVESEPTPKFIATAAADLRKLLPRGTKTVGAPFLPDGRPLVDRNGAPFIDDEGNAIELIWSGVKGPARGAPGVRTDGPPSRRWHELWPVLHHVEGHIAALMRTPNAPTHVTLVISQEPCSSPRGRPPGCDQLIPDVLPRRSVLSVYVANEDGSVKRWKSYIGNGRGVQ